MGEAGATGAPAVAAWLTALDVARRQLRFYPEDHPAVAPAIADVVRLAAGLPAGTTLLQVSPEGFELRDGELGTARARTRQLANQLFQLGVIAFGLRPPIGPSQVEQLVALITSLSDRPSEDDRERVLATAEGIAGIELVPLDPGWFVLSDGIAASSIRTGGLWQRLIEQMTGGALIDGEGGGLSAPELAELVDGAGDPFGFMRLLVDKVLVMLDEAEQHGALLDGLALLAGVEEMVRLVRPEHRRELARLMVQAAESPGALRSRLPEILSVELFLEGVAALLELNLKPPAAVARMLVMLASDDRDSWSRRGLEVSDEERARAAALARQAGLQLSPAGGPLPALPYVERPSMREFLAQMQPRDDPAEALEETAVRAHLDAVMRVAFQLWPRSSLSGALGERLLGSYFEHVELGEFSDAGAIARDLLPTDEPRLLGPMTGRLGVTGLLDAMTVWGKDRRHEVARIVMLLGLRLLPALLDGLRAEDSLSRRRRLLEMVLALGTPAMPHIVPLLADEQWYVVRNAVLLLRRLDVHGSLPQVAPLLEHPDPRVLAEVVKNLTAARDGRALEGVRRLLEQPDDRAWREVVALSARLRHPEVARLIIQRLRACRGAELREPAALALIESLGQFDQQEVYEELLRLANLAQWRHAFRLTAVWQATATAASKLATPAARAVLEHLATLRDPVAEAARSALREAVR